MGAVGDLIGGISGLNAQNQANQAAGQDTNALNSMFGTDQGVINKLISSYFGSGGGAQALTGLLGSLGQQLSSNQLSNPYAAQAATTAGQLQNFNGIKPQELAALQTTMGNSGMSTINTLKGNLGGTANPNSTIQELLGQNSQNSLNLATQLGSLGAQQELGALQSAGGILSGLSSQTLQQQGQDINGILGATNQQGSLLNGGMNNLLQMGNVYGNMAQGSANMGYQQGQNAMNDFGNMFSSIGSMFTGGAAGAGGAASYL